MQKIYKSLGLESGKKKNNIIDNLYKVPIKDRGVNAPTFRPTKDGLTVQSDLLFLPNDNGFKYALVCVDNGSRAVDAEPIKNKDSNTVLKAFKEIFKRKYVKQPTYRLEVDNGTDFKGSVKNYFENAGVYVRVAKTGRSRQQAIVERTNQILGTLLLKRQTAQELITGKDSVEWVEDLRKIIPLLNKHIKKRRIRITQYQLTNEPLGSGDSLNMLSIGDTVRVALDHPINPASGARIHGKFRSSDIRWNPTKRVIKQIILKPNQVVLYLLDGNIGKWKIEPVAYTKNQLQVVKVGEKMPDGEKVIRGEHSQYKVEKIIGKKYIKNKIYYLVKWVGYSKDASTWEPRSTLNEEIPDEIKDYELSIWK
jgi:hypothetical protein